MRATTKDDLRTTANALKNIDAFVMQRIAAESRSEHERIVAEGLYRSNEATQERLRAHYTGQLTQLLRAQTDALKQQVNGEVDSATEAHDRQRAAWEKSLDRNEYNFQRTHLSARVKEARSPAELERLAATATSREAKAALRDLLPDAIGHFGDIMDRARVHSLTGALERGLDEHKPSSLIDSGNRLQAAVDAAHAANAALQQVNNDTNGAIDNELGLSPFSMAPAGERVVWNQQAYQHEGANLLG